MNPTQPSSASYTSLDTEHFLSFLFGKESTCGPANGLLNDATWRGSRRKILRELRRYVDANVLTDAFRQQRLDVAFEKVEEAQGIGAHFCESRRSSPVSRSSASSYSGACRTTGTGGSSTSRTTGA